MKIRKGFTLVELLVVIIIIGIISAAMMISGNSSTATAEASNIISDLRTLRSAALSLYADSMDIIISDYAPNSIGSLMLLKPYLSNPERFIHTGSPYEFFKSDIDPVGLKWWVVYDLDRGNMGRIVSSKLAAKAESVGLFLATNGGAVFVPFSDGDRRVHMVAH